MKNEIERKFWLAHLPNACHQVEPVMLKQGYLAAEPNGSEVRIRKADHTFTLTVKHGHGLERLENEISITQEQFETLWPSTQKRRIHKARFHLPMQNKLILEVDHYLEPLKGLVIAEIEFRGIEEAQAFIPPTWLGQEVTDIPLFSNKTLLRFPTIDDLRKAL